MNNKILISAIGDIHSPTYFQTFWESMKSAHKPDLLLLAGDICEARKPEEYENVLKIIANKKWRCPIIACWGNTEFDQYRDKIKSIVGKKIIFLDDEIFTINIKNKLVGIVGTRGSLDQPTWWQLKNIKNIREIYKKRYEKVSKYLDYLNMLGCDIKIFLTHYSPTYKTMKGEDLDSYGGLGYKKFEDTIKETKPTFVVHAHVHNGIPLAFINSVPIFNVSLPVNKKIVEIDPFNLPKVGLSKFIK